MQERQKDHKIITIHLHYVFIHYDYPDHWEDVANDSRDHDRGKFAGAHDDFGVSIKVF